MPNFENQSQRSLKAITQHILDVIRHLSTLSAQDAQNSMSGENNVIPQNNNASSPFKLLLISDSGSLDDLSEHLTAAHSNLDISTSSLEEFLDAPFNHRYHLGCLIDNNAIDSNSSKSSDSDDSKLVSQYQSLRDAAIRLRDLFAQQSLLFMPSDTDKLQFNDLGYTLLKLTAEVADSEDESSQTHNKTDITHCWQFNLYDYKQHPDWLNAKYWANPENFNKYRW